VARGDSIGCWAVLPRLIVNQLPELHHQSTFLRYSRKSSVQKLVFLLLGYRRLKRRYTFFTAPFEVRELSCRVSTKHIARHEVRPIPAFAVWLMLHTASN